VILVDTAVWIDHLRRGNARLSRLLDLGRVVIHPCVVGELALGNLRRRSEILRLLMELPRATVATDHEVMELIDREALYGSDIGYVDAQLLAAARLTQDCRLWTVETRLESVAARLGLAAQAAR
jgi:predicted nucleic acid-binding protein